MNLATAFTQSAQTHPDRPALRVGTTVVSYGELATASEQVAGLLTQHGIAPGDRVAIMLPNVPEFAAIYYGVLRCGAVVVPMNPLLKSREIAYYLDNSGARVIFVAEAVAGEARSGAQAASQVEVIAVPESGFTEALQAHPRVADVVDRAADDTAVLLYTSGTTGRPKGAELTHDNLIANVEVTQTDLLHLTADDIVFGGLPFFHCFGQTVALNTAMAHGACVLLLPRFDSSSAADQLATYGATVFAGVPTMYAALLGLNDAPELPALRICISGGAALPVEVLTRFEDRFGCTVLEGYGLSETSPVTAFNRPDRKLGGSIGHPVTGVEVRLVDDQGEEVPTGQIGEIAIRGHNVMKCYWKNPDATAAVLSADGWFRTGDMGRADEDGFLFVVDRLKDVIIRGGYNVYPREIEEVLYEHPAVAEAAVIGVADPLHGEEVGAAVALRPGAHVSEDELRDYVKSQVAAYKYPRVVWFTDALPKGPTGKILKREIVAPTQEGTR